MLPTFILRKRVQALRPNAHLVRTAQIIGNTAPQTYTVLDAGRWEHEDGWTEWHQIIGRGYTAGAAWENALERLRMGVDRDPNLGM
jgi:hypothetical protein